MLTTALVSKTRMLATRIPASTRRMVRVRASEPATGTINAKWAGALMVSTEVPGEPKTAPRGEGALLRNIFR